MAEFARRCRDVVVRSSRALTEGSVRLGQWMDWGRDYFTFSDTNIEYIWRFLREMYERGYLYKGHRSTEWCPRCGTSISQHELTQSGVYQERSDPSLFVRFPLLDHPGESLVIWTTTPWTLPANVAAAVQPDADYGLREIGEWVAVARYPDDAFVRTVSGSDLVGLRYRGPFDDLGPGSEVEHRVIPWDDVSRSRREAASCTSRRERARRTSSSAGSTTCPCSLRWTRRAASTTRTAGFTGSRPTESADQIVGRLAETGFLLEAGHVRAPLPALLALRHAAHLAGDGRLAHLGRRAPPAAARRERHGRVDAGVHGQAHGRLAPQHGRLEHLAAPLLRAAAADLRVRVRPCHRRGLEGRARRACRLRARAARGAPPAVDRRGADPLRGVRRDRAAHPGGRRRLARRRHRPVLDARLGEPRDGYPRATPRVRRRG